MATASEILDAIAPELSSAANKQTHLDLADSQTGSVFGEQYEYAVALLAAHTLTLAQRGDSVGGSAGAVSSQKEGQLSVSFGGTVESGALGATSYGTELQRLRRQYIIGARTRHV